MFGSGNPQSDLRHAEQRSQARYARVRGDAARRAEQGDQQPRRRGSVRRAFRRILGREAVEQ